MHMVYSYLVWYQVQVLLALYAAQVPGAAYSRCHTQDVEHEKHNAPHDHLLFGYSYAYNDSLHK